MDATEAELTMLYRQHHALVHGAALRIVGSAATADDVVQEVFMRFFQHRRQGGAEALNQAAFLYRMTTRCALNCLRSSGRRGKYEQRAQAELAHATAPNHETVLTVRHLLSKVPEREATLAAYYYLEGLEHEEIAQLTGIPRRQVGRRLEDFKQRARRLLAQPTWEARRVVDG